MDDSVGTSFGDPVSDSEFATVVPCFGEGCFDDGSGMDDLLRTFFGDFLDSECASDATSSTDDEAIKDDVEVAAASPMLVPDAAA